MLQHLVEWNSMARERQWYEHNILFCEVVLSTIGKQYHSSHWSLHQWLTFWCWERFPNILAKVYWSSVSDILDWSILHLWNNPQIYKAKDLQSIGFQFSQEKHYLSSFLSVIFAHIWNWTTKWPCKVRIYQILQNPITQGGHAGFQKITKN